LDRGEATILRVAAKIPARGLTFGTTLAYVVPGDLPLPLSAQALARQVKAAARAVGIERALGMLDFIARDGRAVMLEMAPRPGGDCLPPLLLRSCGLDVLGAALDFAEGRPVSAPDPAKCRRLVGARFIADRGGVIRRLDDSAVRRDPRVLECALKRGPGDRILVPPEDYDLRILGHAIFDPSPGQDIEAQCRQIAGALKVEMEGAP
jgi:biotin carboxylase